ncbi:AraC family transcriptional regulator [Streptomyces termitum]|uniref:AraC family transcriptional regulator n=1 Tax=Streptomyces termitum TaxID=67368 RepID=A0A918T3T6_9ACTN|nr:AraC family transcriptional regulator [Streptomyces termitum]GHA87629.1 AraC family transcriptional regulator [Streptomyces termitum]
MADHRTRTPDEVRITATGHPTHTHDFHQLLYAPLGRITVTTPDGEHALSSPVALWLPAGTPHSARFDPESLVLAEPFDPVAHPLPFARATAVRLDGDAHRRLLARTRGDGEEDGRAGLFAALTRTGTGHAARLPLPHPTGEATRAVAGALLRRPDDPRTATEWAESLYVSSTSLRRAFRTETGLAFSEWRTRARLNHSLDLLTRGQQVGTVAARVGFTSANGYIMAFRRHFGRTPGAWTREHTGRSAR